MSAADWNRTPWWEQRLLREGLQLEQPWIQRAALLQRVDDPLALRMGAFASEPGDDTDESDDLTSLGVQVRRSNVVTPLYRPAGGE
jgi:hypothetical protein